MCVGLCNILKSDWRKKFLISLVGPKRGDSYLCECGVLIVNCCRMIFFCRFKGRGNCGFVVRGGVLNRGGWSVKLFFEGQRNLGGKRGREEWGGPGGIRTGGFFPGLFGNSLKRKTSL